MAKILFFGRFSDLSDPLELDLPEAVKDKASLTAYLASKLEGFGDLAALSGTRISINMTISTTEVKIKNSDEIAYMSALSGG